MNDDLQKLIYEGTLHFSRLLNRIRLLPWEQAAFASLFLLPISPNHALTMDCDRFHNCFDSAINAIAPADRRGRIFQENGTHNILSSSEISRFIMNVNNGDLILACRAMLFFVRETERRIADRSAMFVNYPPNCSFGGMYFDVCSFLYLCRHILDQSRGQSSVPSVVSETLNSVRLSKNMRCFNMYGHVTTYHGLDQLINQYGTRIVIHWHSLQFYNEQTTRVGVKFISTDYFIPENVWVGLKSNGS